VEDCDNLRLVVETVVCDSGAQIATSAAGRRLVLMLVRFVGRHNANTVRPVS